MLKSTKSRDKMALFRGYDFVEEVPDWSKIKSETVNKYSYNPEHERWEKTVEQIKIAPNPFNYGSQRLCFYVRYVNCKEKNYYVGKAPVNAVAKRIAPALEDRESYFKDVAMQTHAAKFAEVFNSLGVVKKVAFLDAWVIEFPDRPTVEHWEVPGPQCLALEPFLEGEYIKHNNNLDWTESVLARNTPQAFSHFTYELSNQEILVCDLQGVNDVYTDPQFHTKKGMHDERFGTGNLGMHGVTAFFREHRCNQICNFLK
eukprot:UN29971